MSTNPLEYLIKAGKLLPADIPKEIIDLIDKAAGRKHSSDGQVATTLAQILQLAETLKQNKESFTTFLDSRRKQESEESVERPSWDDYFLNICKAVATRGDCKRAQHGAVIVKDKRIVSTGYNGAPSGTLSCLAGDCPRAEANVKPHYQPDYSDCISLHAEQNAIAYANRSDTINATIYQTGEPCDMCAKLIKAAGIVRVVYIDRDGNQKASPS